MRFILAIIAIILFVAMGVLDFEVLGIHSDTPHLLGLAGFGLAFATAAAITPPSWPAWTRERP